MERLLLRVLGNVHRSMFNVQLSFLEAPSARHLREQDRAKRHLQMTIER
jgi:hypothetical protein